MVLLSRNPGAIGKLFGVCINKLFELVYSISPAYSLLITIILFTLLVKLLLLPLVIKQQKSMEKTQALQPKLQALQDKYKGKNDNESQQKLALEMQALYKESGTNPFTGCLLTFIQLPIIYALFDVCKNVHIFIAKLGDLYTNLSLLVMKVPNYETILSNLATAKKLTKNGPIDFTVIDNVKSLFTTLSKADWTALSSDIASHIDINLVNELLIKKNEIETAFGINLINRPSIRNYSIILPLLTALLTYLSIKLTSKNTNTANLDEASKKMMSNMSGFFKIMIVSIFLTSISLPAALSVYWSFNTLLQLLQQYFINNFIKKKPNNDKDKDYIDVKVKEVKE